jgi:hypothetical protein
LSFPIPLMGDGGSLFPARGGGGGLLSHGSIWLCFSCVCVCVCPERRIVESRLVVRERERRQVHCCCCLVGCCCYFRFLDRSNSTLFR